MAQIRESRKRNFTRRRLFLRLMLDTAVLFPCQMLKGRKVAARLSILAPDELHHLSAPDAAPELDEIQEETQPVFADPLVNHWHACNPNRRNKRTRLHCRWLLAGWALLQLISRPCEPSEYRT